jgi:hypothetical protein
MSISIIILIIILVFFYIWKNNYSTNLENFKKYDKEWWIKERNRARQRSSARQAAIKNCLFWHGDYAGCEQGNGTPVFLPEQYS